MPFTAGDKIGPYEILALIGKGGMGEVYRARDTKLDREVAIKVLPDDLAGDPERLARFDREAKVLASLNHANIAHLSLGTRSRSATFNLNSGKKLQRFHPTAGGWPTSRTHQSGLRSTW